jgi:hypothetical protein
LIGDCRLVIEHAAGWLAMGVARLSIKNHEPTINNESRNQRSEINN